MAKRIEHLRCLVDPIGWRDEQDRSADGFFRTVPVQPCGPRIPRFDDAIEGGADYRILRGCDDRGQARVFRLCAHPISEIHGQTSDASDHTRGIPRWPPVRLERPPTNVGHGGDGLPTVRFAYHIEHVRGVGEHLTDRVPYIGIGFHTGVAQPAAEAQRHCTILIRGIDDKGRVRGDRA